MDETDLNAAVAGSENESGGTTRVEVETAEDASSVTPDAAQTHHSASSDADGGPEPGEDEEGALTAPATDPAERIKRIIESVLFASAAPVSVRRLVEILAGPSSKEVLAVMKQLMEEYAPGLRGIQLREVAGGYQFRTARENAEWVRAVFREKPARLGRAALETLAIVAYKQPVTRAEIEAIRGVDVEGVLSTLMSRRLIKITGRKEAVGRPLLYATTAEFLEVFGFRDLNDLPSLKELGPAPDADDEGVRAETDQPGPHTPEGAAEATADTGATTGVGATAGGTAAEDSQPGGDCIAAEGGGIDSSGSRAAERSGSDPAGDEGEPANGSHRD